MPILTIQKWKYAAVGRTGARDCLRYSIQNGEVEAC